MTGTRIQPANILMTVAIMLALLLTNPILGAAILAVALVCVRTTAHPTLVTIATALMIVLVVVTLLFFSA